MNWTIPAVLSFVLKLKRQTKYWRMNVSNVYLNKSEVIHELREHLKEYLHLWNDDRVFSSLGSFKSCEATKIHLNSGQTTDCIKEGVIMMSHIALWIHSLKLRNWFHSQCCLDWFWRKKIKSLDKWVALRWAKIEMWLQCVNMFGYSNFKAIFTWR